MPITFIALRYFVFIDCAWEDLAVTDERGDTDQAIRRYPHVLSPMRVGGVMIRNRVFSSAHGTGFATVGLINDRHIEYHRARARGGIGLIVIEATSVDSSPLMGGGSRNAGLRNSADDVLPGYRALSAAVHAEGARIFCLLSHSGRNSVMSPDGRPPVAPSSIPMDRTRDIPHELEREEIEAIVEAFANAARRCREGGLDGVELSFTHGNLVQQFLSPSSNKRQDEYGGSEERRLRLAREVLQACRAAVGPDFPLGIRFSADELIEDGYRLADGLRYAVMMQEWGALDFIDVSAGTNSDMRSRSAHYPTISSPERPLVDLAAAVRKVVSVPVFCIGKIPTLDDAEEIVASQSADMVGMTRAHIAEPAIVRKTVEGRADDIRECIYCNESCFARQQRFSDISCVYNPRSGREVQWPQLSKADRKRKVAVVGGGPAGMEAARVAAKRGHQVRLFEAADTLGGQIRDLSKTPERAGYAKIAEWYSRQLEKLSVDIVLGANVDLDTLVSGEPDEVILASGAREDLGGIPGSDASHVFGARRALDGAQLGKKVVVIDHEGRHMGTSVAEHFSVRGHEVTLVTPAFFVGLDQDYLTWHPTYERLLRQGVEMRALEKPIAIGADHVEVERVDRSVHRIPADSVVICSRGYSNRSLYRGLLDAGVPVKVVGDAWSPRQIEQAVFEASRAAREI